MRILYVVYTFDGCAWYRCSTPANALQRIGHECRVQDSLCDADIDWCDVLVGQRLWSEGCLRGIQRANSLGKLTVADLVDDLDAIYAVDNSKAAQAFRKQLRQNELFVEKFLKQKGLKN